MKKTNMLLACLLMLLYLGAAGTDKYEVNSKKVISSPVEGNLYLAGTTLTIDATVGGDLTAAGQYISVNDSIYDDVILAGAEININGVLGDDAKIAGKDIRIMKSVHGDLMLAGAYILINEGVIIDKDLAIMAGEATINGTIKGNVKVTGGTITFNGIAQKELDIKADELTLNGIIQGPATILSNEIEVGDDLSFQGDVTYWSEEETPDLTSYADGAVLFDQELEQKQGADSGGKGITYYILYSLSVTLVMVLLVLFLHKPFQKAGIQITQSYLKNLGYGLVYFIGLPILTILSIVLIIGIPVGLVTFTILAFSLLFANVISSLVIANGINSTYDKNWNKWRVMLVALVSFLAIKLVGLIPFVGWIIVVIVVGMAFGSMIRAHLKLKT